MGVAALLEQTDTHQIEDQEAEAIFPAKIQQCSSINAWPRLQRPTLRGTISQP
jgi:hypothetical protein